MFNKVVSFSNLCKAWKEFVKNKKRKKEIAEFSLNLSRNLFILHNELINKTYYHGSYKAFRINDPKPRIIHKASVRDRVLHRAIYRILYPHFDQRFIASSFSCRNNKGTHRGLNYFESLTRKSSINNTITSWILKCDIKKFFDSIDQIILLNVLRKYIVDKNMLWLLGEVINSFNAMPNKGMPLGNLTSQLFANIYMNELDQFVKHKLLIKYYVRYADDFAIINSNKEHLKLLIPIIKTFLENKLNLFIHPNKIFIKTWAFGLDFLGWISFPDHRVLRTTTKRRMLKRIEKHPEIPTVTSYLGILKHGNTYKLRKNISAITKSKY